VSEAVGRALPGQKQNNSASVAVGLMRQSKARMTMGLLKQVEQVQRWRVNRHT